MALDLVPLASFVLVTTFTPGPNNISSAAMGMLHGYRGTIRFMAGVAAGFFLVMLLCALVSSVLLGFMPSVQPVLRLAGAAYILWLAWCTARASYGFTDTGQARLGFDKGFLLQLLNPKVIVYGLALYSSFLSPLAGRPLALVLFALPLTVVCFCAVSTWALCGAAIRRALVRPRVRILVNTVLVLLLAWCAVDLSGLAGI